MSVLSKRIFGALLAACLLALPGRVLAFDVIWMSDTQHYYGSRAEIFHSMSEWILESRERLDIRLVLHSGDIVSASRSEEQWDNAAKAMAVLHGKIPYLCAAGNHDVGSRYRYDNYYNYVDKIQDPALPGGVYLDGQSRYALLSAEGRDYLFLSIGFFKSGPDEALCKWVNDVLKEYPEHIVVLITHSYLHADGERLTTQGRAIYRDIVEPNPNVWLVLSGHCRRPARKVQAIDADGDGVAERSVYAVMANYQDAPEGGGGYLRILRFDPEFLRVSTYSPYLDDYVYFEKPGQDVFSIPYPAEEGAGG